MSIRVTFRNICRKANVVLIIKKAMQDLLQDNRANLGNYFFLFVCLFAVLFWARRTGPPPPGIVWDSAAAAKVGGASQIFSSVGSKDPLEIGRECE